MDVIGRKMAAKGDPVLARAMQVEAKEHQSPLMFRLAALRLVYTTFVVFGLHKVNPTPSKTHTRRFSTLTANLLENY